MDKINIRPISYDTIPKLYRSGFAFILMDDPRDAEDAVKELDGTRMCGRRVKVCFLTYKIRNHLYTLLLIMYHFSDL